jgi:hypothetical protein
MPVSKAVVFSIIYLKTKWKSLVYNKNPLALQSRHLQHWFTLYSKSMKASGVKKPLANVFACSINWRQTKSISTAINEDATLKLSIVWSLHFLALSGMLQTRRLSLCLFIGILQTLRHSIYLMECSKLDDSLCIWLMECSNLDDTLCIY